MLDYITAENRLSCENMILFIFIGTINTSVNSVIRHKILIYFTGNSLQCGISSYDYYVESKYTPDLPGFFVLLSAHVKTAVYQGMFI